MFPIAPEAHLFFVTVDNHRSRNSLLTAEYSEERSTTQQKRENIGKMGTVPFPKGKSELLQLFR